MLTPKQKRYLSSLANKLKPTVMLGKNEISDSFIETFNNSLNSHELVKISILKTCPMSIEDIKNEILNKTQANYVNSIGKTILFYKESKKCLIKLP